MAAFLNKHELVATLLSRGVDINAAGHYYGTALQAAARHGHNDMALQLISAGAQVNILQGQWETALRAAIVGRHEDVVRMPTMAQTSIWDQSLKHQTMEIYLLLEHGADVKQTVEGCKSPLSLAVEVEDQSLVRLLLKHGANIGTVLTEAAEHNHLGIVQNLVAAAAKADTDQTYWKNPIMAALKKPYGGEVKDIRIVEVLLEALMETPDPGPIIEEALSEAIGENNNRGMSLVLDYVPISTLRLCQACSAGAEEAVMHMLKHGVNPNEADNNDDYPIHLAAAHLQLGVVNILIEHRVDLNATNREGKTPLQAALEACAGPRLDFSDSGPPRPKGMTARKRRRLFKWPQDIRNSPPTIEFPKFHRCEQIAATLLDNGARPVSVTTCPAGLPLHLACLIGSKQTIVKLLEKGANVNEIGGHFGHVLVIAIATSRPDLVALLLQHGADPNYSHDHYGTPLHLAEKAHSTLSDEHLLEHGADAAKRDADGNHLPLE